MIPSGANCSQAENRPSGVNAAYAAVLPKPRCFKAATAAVRVWPRAPRWNTVAKSARVTNFFLIGGGGICAAILWGAGTGAETLGTGDTENGGIMADTGATAGGKTGAGAE